MGSYANLIAVGFCVSELQLNESSHIRYVILFPHFFVVIFYFRNAKQLLMLIDWFNKIQNLIHQTSFLSIGLTMNKSIIFSFTPRKPFDLASLAPEFSRKMKHHWKFQYDIWVCCCCCWSICFFFVCFVLVKRYVAANASIRFNSQRSFTRGIGEWTLMRPWTAPTAKPPKKHLAHTHTHT